MIGVDISDRSIKIAEIETHRSGSFLRTICWSPLSANLIRRGVVQDVSIVTQALVDAFQKCSPVPVSERGAVVASIPETQSFVRVLDLPEMSSEETSEAVQWAVRQHIPFDLDRVYLDWQAVNTSQTAEGRQQVLVGAVQRDVVDPLLSVFDGAGLHVVALELEAQAIVRSLLPIDSSTINGVLIVDLGATSTNIILFDQGSMRFTSSIQIGGDDVTRQLSHSLGIEPKAAADKKASIGLVAKNDDESHRFTSALHGVMLDLFKQVKKVTDDVGRQLDGGEGAVKAVLLSGGSANMPGIQSVVAEVFSNTPIQAGNPWTNVTFPKNGGPPLSPIDTSHFITAIGLALREDNSI